MAPRKVLKNSHYFDVFRPVKNWPFWDFKSPITRELDKNQTSDQKTRHQTKFMAVAAANADIAFAATLATPGFATRRQASEQMPRSIIKYDDAGRCTGFQNHIG